MQWACFSRKPRAACRCKTNPGTGTERARSASFRCRTRSEVEPWSPWPILPDAACTHDIRVMGSVLQDNQRPTEALMMQVKASRIVLFALVATLAACGDAVAPRTAAPDADPVLSG